MSTDEIADLARDIGAAASRHGRTVVAAESVTAGRIGLALAAAPEASTWFRGSIVAYMTETKTRVLGVTASEIISAECARQMAEGALARTAGDIVVAVTGVGGPDPEEDKPPGTVVICAGHAGALRIFEHEFAGPPEHVVDLATLHAMRHLKEAALAHTR